MSYKLIILPNTTSKKNGERMANMKETSVFLEKKMQKKKKKSSPQQQKGTLSGAHNLNVCLCCHSGILASQRTGDILIKA